MGILLMRLSGIGWKQLGKPRAWSASVSFHAASIIAGAFFSLNALLLILDPEWPMWLRYLVADLPFVTIVLGMLPYLHSLASPLRLPLPGYRDPFPTCAPLHLILWTIPPLIGVHLGCMMVRGVMADMGDAASRDLWNGLAHFIIGFICLIISCTCGIYGIQFASSLRLSILIVEDGLEKVRSSMCPSGQSSSVGMTDPIGLSHPPDLSHSTGIDPGMKLHGIISSTFRAFLNIVHHLASPLPAISTASRTLTTIEARAVLRKVTYLNIILMVCNFTAGIMCITMAALPSMLFEIIPLSKAFFFFLLVSMPLKLQVVLLCNLYAEWIRRRSQRVLRAEEPSLTTQAQEIQQSLVISVQSIDFLEGAGATGSHNATIS
ncbi:hypothetical protein BJ684DRAFT_16581 [Piptocephalis cylindrospora]|uniref:Uncharacterized protein n=1 Tax=Piptocephalis cylindrospora TaxID=1907219 RepID=A0A4P9Y2C5_9FUNG|nr:hypothetical protein BJ684DRAFT_16581 [Piptocephalis cylindrospora]|eukprot:RKP12977.1 hypothetical protein BJ684DRAFT_16581 [Piptocephalis cylindrospora]